VQTGANSRGNERGSSVQQQGINQMPNWMAFVDSSNSKNASTAKKEF